MCVCLCFYYANNRPNARPLLPDMSIDSDFDFDWSEVEWSGVGWSGVA